MTLLNILDQHASERPNRTAYVFLHDDGQQDVVSFGQLARRARAIAAHLQGLGMSGERVILQYKPGLHFIEAILGCFYAGVVATPVVPVRNRRELPRVSSVMRDCGSRLVLTSKSTYAVSRALHENVLVEQNAEMICTDDIPDSAADGFRPVDHAPSSLCFLQYTSGSTGNPKGVMVTHANLMHNSQMLKSAFEADESAVIVSWLPLYHDMGLIFSIFQPLYLGTKSVLFSPMSFVSSPMLWLRAISDWRATTSGAPSFAYELCVHRMTAESMQGIDLSSWKIAFNGAEPVKSNVIDAFVQKFTPYGFREEAFYPCYGMAEATLMVSGGSLDAKVIKLSADSEKLAQNVIVEQPESKTVLVGCGTARAGQVVRIVDPESLKVLPDGRVGEVWIAGESVAAGYWGRPEETAATFQGRTEAGEGPFLRSGDLGFLRDGEIFITGRIKDLLIIRGSNHYPADIETTVCQGDEALRPGCAAAFTVEDEQEAKLVVVVEAQRTALSKLDEAAYQAILTKVRREVTSIHGLRLSELVVISTGTLPKTSSGKIRRNYCRDLYLSDGLKRVHPQVGQDVDSKSVTVV